MLIIGSKNNFHGVLSLSSSTPFNTEGYYDGLVALLDQMIEEQMMRPVFGTMFQVVKTPEEVLPAILNMPEWDRNARKNAKI